MNHSKQKQNRGFTLIEMIVAVFIFSLSLAALMAISSRGIKVAHQAQKQVVADYLALEGIEVVRNIRDSAFLASNNVNNWQNIFDQDGCLSSGLSCKFILDSEIILQPCSGSCRVYFNEEESSYRHKSTPGSVDSGFTREILFIPTGDPRELIVEVIVSWANGEVSYTEDLFLWL